MPLICSTSRIISMLLYHKTELNLFAESKISIKIQHSRSTSASTICNILVPFNLVFFCSQCNQHLDSLGLSDKAMKILAGTYIWIHKKDIDILFFNNSRSVIPSHTTAIKLLCLILLLMESSNIKYWFAN